MKQVVYIVIFALYSLTSIAQTEIGGWRDHLPYTQSIMVAEGKDHVFCANKSALFSYDKTDKSLERLSKVNALSGVGISSITINETRDILLVGYVTGNIDLITENLTVNIPDIMRNTTLSGSKAINNAFFQGNLAYLATDFGIVVLDMIKQEIKDTYSIGPTLGQITVNEVAIFNDTIYAACNDGLYYGDANDPFLVAYSQWTKDTRFPLTTSAGPFVNVVGVNNQLYASYNHVNYEEDTVYYKTATGWSPHPNLTGKENYSIEGSANELLVCHWDILELLDNSFNVLQTLSNLNGTDRIRPMHAIYSNTEDHTYIADESMGLVRVNSSTIGNSFYPNGPFSTKAFAMASSQGETWVASGGVRGNAWNNTFNRDGVFLLKEESWSYMNATNEPVLLPTDSVYDFISIGINPSNPAEVYVGTHKGGLLEFKKGKLINRYSVGNSGLKNWELPPETWVGVGGVAIDESNNVWMSNENVPSPIVVKKPDGTWVNLATGSVIANQRLGAMLIDDAGQKWLLKPFNGSVGGLFVFSESGTIDNPSDDKYKLLDKNPGNGGLPTNDVRSFAKDLDGRIWVGTAQGVAVFYSPESVLNSSNFDSQPVYIEQDGNIQILLETEIVSAVAIDGANRKWFGTQNSGVFLMSADGTEQLLAFNAENSPLLDNNVLSITIDEITGEVFFGTESGIVTYRNTAITASETYSNVYAFPNPVREDYEGDIAIKGLKYKNDVKIVDVTGNLVFETVSEGGQAIWNGRDLFGTRVATGVYYVLAVDESGDERTATKILVVR